MLPPGRGRGSSVSSIVCYLTGLSHVDPVETDLFAGRFLNDQRQRHDDLGRHPGNELDVAGVRGHVVREQRLLARDGGAIRDGVDPALDELRADPRLAALFTLAQPRVLDVPEPRRAVLTDAARRARCAEIVVRD